MTIARAMSDTFAGIRPGHAPAFIAAQLIGAVLATWLFGWLLRPIAALSRREAAPRRRPRSRLSPLSSHSYFGYFPDCRIVIDS